MKRIPDQVDLFRSPDIPREPVRQAPYQPASDTSKRAADNITPRASDLRTTVLRSIIAAGERGATRKELEESTGMLTQTVTPRLNELEHAGEIRKLTALNHAQQEERVRRDGCSVYVVAKAKAVA